MQYVELAIRPGGQWFQDVDGAIAAHPSLRHGPIHEIRLLDDGTVVVLYEIHGDPAAVTAVYEDDEESRYQDTVSADGVTYVFSQFDPSPVVRGLLETVRTRRVAVLTPIRVIDESQLRVGLVTDGETAREAVADLPDAAGVTVAKTGPYRPSDSGPFGDLTERQQEVLLAALELGYYRQPREATYEDVAAAVGCSANTVGDHLRSVEGRILRRIAPTSGR